MEDDGKSLSGNADRDRFTRRWLWLIPLVILGFVAYSITIKTAKPKGPEEQTAGLSELKAFCKLSENSPQGLHGGSD